MITYVDLVALVCQVKVLSVGVYVHVMLFSHEVVSSCSEPLRKGLTKQGQCEARAESAEARQENVLGCCTLLMARFAGKSVVLVLLLTNDALPGSASPRLLSHKQGTQNS